VTISTSGPLDLPASQWTAAALHQTFLTRGCAVVREAIQPRLVKQVSDITGLAYHRKGEPEHVDEEDIVKAHWWRRTDPYTMAASPLLQDFLHLVFGGPEFKRLGATARRIRGQELHSVDWQKPLELHLDSFFHPFEWTVNFWIPFDPCGEEAPCLQLVPVDYKRTREFSQFSFEKHREAEHHFGHFPEDVLAMDRVVSEFGENCFLRPKMQPGDIIISSNWIIHGTYQTPQMTKGRTSIELRYIGERLDPG
jgi:ectoine hydroxylase-related dioxygenase (phytanoyl-CoA dioxygenase family)